MPQPNSDTAAHAPMVDTYGPHSARPFSRFELRKRVGPSNPTYHLLQDLLVQDVVSPYDDFTGTLDTLKWTATKADGGGAAGSNFATRTATFPGLLRGTTSADTDGADVRLIGAIEYVVTNARPVLLTRVQPTTITTSKFEVGFVDAVGAGAVLVKATPTSTSTDYAVIVRDTNHNTSVDLHVDSTTNAVAAVAGAASLPTWATATFFTLMLALDEQNAAYFWINGGFGGVQRGNGPDDDVTLAPWFYCQNRSGAAHSFDIDYAKVWQERTVFA